MTAPRPQCLASVPVGTYTYMARTTDRRCKNPATVGAYCHAHRRYAEVTPTPDFIAELRANLERAPRE